MNFETLTSNLEKLNYIVSEFATKEEASHYLCEKIKDETVGFAGSVSLQEMDLYSKLSQANEVFWHMDIPLGSDSNEVRKAARLANIYISSVNGISEKGEIVNIDHTGNRVSSISFGHQKVYLIIGINKLTKTYEEALYRAKNIAAPLNAARLNVKTPCAIKKDKCYDCKSPQRICRNLSVLWNKPSGCDYEIILINEALGY